MAGASDGELWLAAAAGSEDAFGRLFERHAKTVYNYCFRRTGDWALAEDLTSAVFLEAWRRRREIDSPAGSMLPWLLGVATNLLRNTRRALRRYRAVLEDLRPRVSDPDFSDEVASRIDAERSMRAILGLVASLPTPERDVLALCTWTGLTYEEAAQSLGVPVGTVRSRLSRARAHLRELSGLVGQEEARRSEWTVGQHPTGEGDIDA